MWLDHIDPAMREEALRIEDDDLGFAHVKWRGQSLQVADVQVPHDTEHNGRHHESYRNGRAPEYRYFRRHVRVSAFSYEEPRRLEAKSDDLYMCCSDFPHSEGTASPVADYAAKETRPESSPGLFHDDPAFLLREVA